MSSGRATSSRCSRSSANFRRSRSCWSARPRAGPVADQIAALGHAGDRLGGQRSAGVSFEQLAATQSNVGRMRAAGRQGRDRHDRRQRHAHTCSRSANMPAISSRFSKVPGATGVSWGEALAMISSRPAEAIGMGGEIGSLAPGRRADVVIWSGDPLEGRAPPSGLDRRRPPAAREPPDRAARPLPLPAARATCRRRTGVDSAGRPCPVRHRVRRDCISCCRTRCARPLVGALGERAVPAASIR